MKQVSCGIDFGTTNSSAAISIGLERPKMVKLENNSETIPSAIFFSSKNNNAFFGREAQRLYKLGESGRFMRSIKRVLGTPLMSTGTLVNSKTLKFVEILSYFIDNIKHRIDNMADDNVENVVMGRPVHFIDNNPDGDIKATDELCRIAKYVGFKNVEFQFEPIAAAFAHEAKIKGEKLACVIDIGGGTSDFTIIKLGEKLSKKTNRKDDILASTGVRTGGNDFDKNLSIKSFADEFGFSTTYGAQNLNVPKSIYFDLAEWSQINSVYTYKNINMMKKILKESHNKKFYGRLLDLAENELGHRLLEVVETTKIELTKEEKISINLNFLEDTPIIDILREDFENSIAKNTNIIRKSLEDCLSQAEIGAEKIELVILTGGSTEIPYVQKELQSLFPNAELSQEDKLSSVGLGLAYDSARKFGTSLILS